MSYILKPKTEFEKELHTYLEENPIAPSFEENLINNFSSSKLSDLYGLFLKLENRTLTPELYNELEKIINTNFPEYKDAILSESTNNISSEHLHALENVIKDVYMNHISDSKNSMIDTEEFNLLTVIMNKVFPSTLLQLIHNENFNINKLKEFVCKKEQTSIDDTQSLEATTTSTISQQNLVDRLVSSNIQAQQKFITDKIMDTIEHYALHKTEQAKSDNADIAGAIYIAANNLYPHLAIYVPGRVKSFKSAIDNLNKETKKSIQNLIPSNLTEGLSNANIEKNFNLDKANTDFSGLTIVLANTDDTMHFDKNDPSSSEILKLRKIRNDNIDFTHKLENFLQDNEDNYLSNTDLLQIQIDLLKRLRNSTYDECYEEYQGTSFNQLLKQSIQKYEQEITNSNSSPISNDDSRYSLEINRIYLLLEELQKRAHDKYQAKLLEIAVPNILKDEIFTDTLNLKFTHAKSVKKPNGFCCEYYYLETEDGRTIELQVQSQKRYKDSKNGPSDHSKLANKQIDISHFFEPVNPNCTEEQFKELIDILNNTSIDKRNYLNETAISQLSPTDRRLKKRIALAEENIRLKESFETKNQLPDGTSTVSTYSLDKYLPIFAKYVSPEAFSVSSYHTRENKDVSEYGLKDLLDGFSTVLLKQDAISCLSQMLIRKLDTLIPNNRNQISLDGIKRRHPKKETAPNKNGEER